MTILIMPWIKCRVLVCECVCVCVCECVCVCACARAHACACCGIVYVCRRACTYASVFFCVHAECVCTRVLCCCARCMPTVQYVPFNLYSLLSVIGRKIMPTITPATCAAGKQERSSVDGSQHVTTTRRHDSNTDLRTPLQPHTEIVCYFYRYINAIRQITITPTAAMTMINDNKKYLYSARSIALGHFTNMHA